MHGAEAKLVLLLLSCQVLSSHVPSSVQFLKKLISPKGNFFHVDKANENVVIYGLIYEQFHHGHGF